jgi:hypothetical protein
VVLPTIAGVEIMEVEVVSLVGAMVLSMADWEQTSLKTAPAVLQERALTVLLTTRGMSSVMVCFGLVELMPMAAVVKLVFTAVAAGDLTGGMNRGVSIMLAAEL